MNYEDKQFLTSGIQVLLVVCWMVELVLGYFVCLFCFGVHFVLVFLWVWGFFCFALLCPPQKKKIVAFTYAYSGVGELWCCNSAIWTSFLRGSLLPFSSALLCPLIYKNIHQPSIYNFLENQHMPFSFLLDKLRIQIAVENNQ